MKRILSTALALAVILTAGAKAKKDPVLMTVDGVPVTLSEFEYLYHKNNDQQLDKQSLDEYLEMFKVYKLKVAEARHQQVDTTAAFRKEFAGYRAELVAPYLRDAATEQRLVDEAYDHMKEQVRIDHLMLPLNQRDKADSLARVLKANPGIFLSLAQVHSVDPSLPQNNGVYGWISAGQYPYEFEEAAYNTPVHSVSDVITTRFGYHLVRVNERRDNPGEVRASHILVSGTDDAAKERIDSIYQALRDGADFATLAAKVSSCPSGAQGGDLGYFGPGRMVPEFEAQAFALAEGEMSEPFTTRFGWHIVKRTGTKGIADKATLEPGIRRSIERDGRMQLAVKAKADQLAAEYGAKVLPAGRDALLDTVRKAGSLQAASEALLADRTPLITVADSVVTIADFMTPMPRLAPGEDEIDQLGKMIDSRFQEVVLTYEDHRLESKYPELRNIVGEYRDGMMLFEVSNANVWNVPVANTEGLENFFRAHKEKYATWDEPRFKGYVIYATSDSLLNEVEKYLADNKPAASEVGEKLKEAFPRNIKIERVVLPKGKNRVVDYLGFGAERPEMKNEQRWKAYTSYAGRVVAQPEEAADCRAAVSADYQQELEKQWVESLRAKYPVKVDKKVLKKVKPL